MAKRGGVVFGYEATDYGTTTEDAFRPEQYKGAVADLKADQRQARKLKAGAFATPLLLWRSHFY